MTYSIEVAATDRTNRRADAARSGGTVSTRLATLQMGLPTPRPSSTIQRDGPADHRLPKGGETPL